MFVKSFLLLVKTLQLFRRTPQRETSIAKQWRLQKIVNIVHWDPLNMEKSWFHWTFELMAKKPHIPQSLKSLIEDILSRWS